MAETYERPGGVKELGHLVLYVRDLERSVRFYRDVLGWRQVGPEGDGLPFPAAMFSSGRTHHELLLIEVGPDAAPIPAGRRVASTISDSRWAIRTTSSGPRSRGCRRRACR
jgi:catechol 2,3-dioxygenase-like lactoylglutathione lyase family enzyme